jgi:CRP-like cAMP-binding protein
MKRASDSLPVPCPTLRQIRKAFPDAAVMKFKSGDEIFAENTIAHSLFYVTAGRVQIYRKLKNGNRLFLARLQKGDFLGEMALLAGGRRSANARAESGVEVLELRFDRLSALIAKKHPLAGEIGLYTSALLAERMQHVLSLLVKEAEKRPAPPGRKNIELPYFLKQVYSSVAV